MTKMDKKNLGLKDRGDFYERTEHNSLEKAFAEHWQRENKTRTCAYHGVGLLQALFDTPGHRHQVSESERFVAATVVQWLGTNCGFGFLCEVLRKDGMRIVDIKSGKEIHHFGQDMENPYRRKFADA